MKSSRSARTFFVALVAFSITSWGSVRAAEPWYPVPDSDRQRIESRLRDLAQAWQSKQVRSFGVLVLRAGMSWLGTPYQRYVLDEVTPEQLVIRTSVFSCVTLVELSLAMARAAACGQTDLAAVQRETQALRYRGGVIDGYASRLHYFSQWIEQGAALGVLRDLSAELGGVALARKHDYMTSRPSKYPPLANPQAFAAIKAIEEERSQRTFRVIEVAHVPAIEGQLKAGDIIALVTSQPGILVMHTGLISPMADAPHLLHASSGFGHVGIGTLTLSQYLARRSDRQGILVARPLAPSCQKD